MFNRLRISLNSFKTISYCTGKEPWINETTICTYPDPWIRRTPSANGELGDNELLEEDNLNESEDLDDQDNVNSDDNEWNQVVPDVVNGDIQNKAMYIGNYEHKAFGTFYIFDNGTLMYRMGRFLNGHLNATADKDKLRMTLGFPLHYRLRPAWQLTITFSGNVSENGVYKYTTIKVPYLESDPPPEFERPEVTRPSPTPTPGEGGRVVLSVSLIFMAVFIQFT